jgi:hypothetical protein
VRFLRVIVAVLTALLAVVVLAPAASAAESESESTIQIRGLEYGVSTTEGKFGGTARGALSGAWLATVVHEPLRKGKAVPVTGGSFTLRGRGPDLGGTFVRGTVAPLDASSTCENERFDVTGTLALRGGGTGSFAVVLTHLRVRTGSGCRPYGAVVAGTLKVPSGALA